MNFFKKHFLFRVLTGSVFASLAWSNVRNYQLLDFTYAAEISFIFVLLSYLFLSQNYTPMIQSIFLIVGFILIAKLQPRTRAISQQSDEFLRARTLFLQVIRYNLDGDQSLAVARTQNLDFCLVNDCPDTLQKLGGSYFWFFEKQYKPDDKTKSLWYIDENMRLFSRVDQNFSRIQTPILSGQE